MKILRVLYFLALAYLSAIIFIRLRRSCQIWPRNSYLTKAFTPLKSDLDTTAYFLKEPNIKDLNALNACLRHVKYLFPALGETNIWDKDNAIIFTNISNPLELSRDPYLLRNLNIAPSSPSIAEKLVYLLRLEEADLKNLVYHPETRKKKWQLHFEACELNPLDQISLSAINNVVVELGLKYGIPIIQENLESYQNALLEADPLHLMTRRSWFKVEHIMMFPHRFCFLPEENLQRAAKIEKLHALAIAQLRWEIVGIYTQINQIASHEGIALHINRMEQFLKVIDSKDQELLHALKKLKSR